MVSMVRSMGRISGPRLINNVYPLKVPLGNGGPSGWRPYPLFRGSTRGIYDFSCHASVLNTGSCPHPPHTHDEEELLLLLSGEVDLFLPRAPGTGSERGIHLEPGNLVYYPLEFPHTLKTTSKQPANYLMFKWTGGPKGSGSELTFGEFNMMPPADDAEPGFRTQVVFEGPTSYLRKLHFHTSVLTPGAAYEPHSDSYDVAIVVLEGEVDTIGKRVGPYGVIFYGAGMPHGMRNTGGVTSRYVVFEFHNQR
jgi:mannose-6-phosphate isomerase-like protein (cupin superfamily)